MQKRDQTGVDANPVCGKCGFTMRLSCTEPMPNKPGFVHHVYECKKCWSTRSIVAPMPL
jgi:hypothetical protein